MGTQSEEVLTKTDQVNSWLSLGANLGVLIGLILLIVELDQNSDLVRAQIHQARSDNFESFMVQKADTEFLQPALIKFRAAGGLRDLSALEELDLLEIERIRDYYRGRIMGYDNLFYQYRNGFLDEDFYKIRVVNPIRGATPLWIELGLIRLGADNPYVTKAFANEIERIMSSE